MRAPARELAVCRDRKHLLFEGDRAVGARQVAFGEALAQAENRIMGHSDIDGCGGAIWSEVVLKYPLTCGHEFSNDDVGIGTRPERPHVRLVLASEFDEHSGGEMIVVG